MIRRLSPRQWVFDAVVPGAILVLFLLPAIAGGGVELLSLVGFCAALVVRRWFTLLSLGIAWLTAIAQMAVHADPVATANVLIVGVLYATGAHAVRLVRWLGFASAVVGAICVAGYLTILPAVLRENDETGSRLTFEAGFTFSAALAGFLLSWATGTLVRVIVAQRRASAEAAQAAREVIAEQERTRIARDMHDVVAHSLAVVIAQADGARYLRASSPESVDEALVTIAGTAREALADVRVLLAQLRHDQGHGPQPELADLGRLYEQFRAAGMDLRIGASGTPLTPSTSTQLAVYRIVQESLTNALRHGDTGAPVEVGFDWAPGGLHVSVVNEVNAQGAPTGGHGLAGMTERAHLVGGRFDVARDATRFVVRVWLPVEPRTSTAPIAVAGLPGVPAGSS